VINISIVTIVQALRRWTESIWVKQLAEVQILDQYKNYSSWIKKIAQVQRSAKNKIGAEDVPG
jgi:hypothetical protein